MLSIDKQNPTHRAALRRVPSILEQAGYTRDAVRKVLRTEQHLSAEPGDAVVFERRAGGNTPLEAMIRLFLLGLTLTLEEAASCLPAGAPAVLEEAGLLEPVAGGVRATVRLAPHGDIAVACDRSHYADRSPTAADVVTGVTSPAVLLADLTVRPRCRRGLDLGTGGGIQALLLAKHCEHVVAVDVNPRALDFCRLNMEINGFDNIEPRLGSWFEPVARERFDLITANPPYVMSPDSSYLYRDSGMKADELCRQLIRDIPGHLEEGGFGHILISWALHAGEEWSAPIRRWIEGLPCDFWLLHYLTEDPLTQAAKWNQGVAWMGLDEYGAAIDRWTDYYRSEGIDQIAFGGVVMRRRTAPDNWVRADTFKAGGGSSSGLIRRVFEAEDHLRSLGDDSALLAETFRLVPEHRLEQVVRFRDGVWRQASVVLTLTQGISFTAGLDMVTANVLQHIDGLRPLRESVDEAGRELGLSAGDVEDLRLTAVEMVRRLYQLGFFERVN